MNLTKLISLIFVGVVLAGLLVGVARWDAVNQKERLCDLAAVDSSYQQKCANAIKGL